MSEETKAVDRLLTGYLALGIGVMVSFLIFAALLLVFYLRDGSDLLFLFLILASGFLWIGLTSLCRHALVRLKFQIGNKVSIIEFLSTQLVVFLFPFYYFRLKKEVALFKDKQAGKSIP